MTSTLQTTPLDLQVRLQLTQLLDHVKQNPDQWVSINGQMYEYHPPAINERLVPIIKPIFQLVCREYLYDDALSTEKK
ncbi:hypothetical protein CRV24_007450 [Beauveria bassiana]|nr:hypothetical protein CRV24_007450 [Beauveria bassiana]KAH8712360.1 hypothetical protein HC256_005556 [Beauveria bassiana]